MLRLMMMKFRKFVVLLAIPLLFGCGEMFEPREEANSESNTGFSYVYEGALEITNNQEWLLLVPSDSDGVRTGSATIKVQMNAANDGRVESAEVVMTSSDSKGEFTNTFHYDIKEREALVNRFDKQRLNLTAFDDAGHVDVEGQGTEQQISGQIRLDNRPEIFGRFVIEKKNRR